MCANKNSKIQQNERRIERFGKEIESAEDSATERTAFLEKCDKTIQAASQIILECYHNVIDYQHHIIILHNTPHHTPSSTGTLKIKLCANDWHTSYWHASY